MSRIEPLRPPYSDAVTAWFERVVPEGVGPPRAYRVLARNESLFGELVDNGTLGLTGLFDRGVLPTRLRELLILRTCVATNNEYEWRLHVDSGLSTGMGLSDNDIAATRADDLGDNEWTPAEQVAVDLVDALVQRVEVDDELFSRLHDHYDDAMLIEMAQLIGWYTIVAFQMALADLRPRD